MTSILPNEINALISTFLEDEEGDFFRKQAGNVIIKDVRNSKTYGNGLLHSFNDQPAMICDSSQYWFKHGKRHRDMDQPAVILVDGSQFWYQNGERHRNGDKPAVIWVEGSQCWYYRGKRHRSGNKPAMIWTNGTQWYYQNGKRCMKTI